MTNHVAPVLPGETFGGKYRVERVLGQGGMGIVVAARHLDLDERVAIKFLLGSPSELSVDRFLREARAAVKVKGEHVCRVFDFGRLETGEPYIVMEYLEGVDLAKKLAQDGPQPVANAVGWIVETCAALAEAHAHGIVHRDLKPANVLLANRPDGSRCAKVLDFGISKLPHAETITNPAAMMGSPVYMSPEQMESARDVDARSDLWSLGVMTYELLTGKPPFRGESMVQLAVQVREEEPAPIDAIAVPEGLRRAIAKCLEKKPGDRYATVGELVTDLAPFAPPDVAPLVARITGRTEPKATLAFDVTATAESAPLRGTFSPLQSTLGAAPLAKPRRWPVFVGGAAALGIAAVLLARTPTPPAPIVALPEAAVVSLESPPPSLAPAPEPDPPAKGVAVADAGAPLAVAPSRPAKPASPPPPARTASAEASVASPPPAPPAPTGDGRKKRVLDRDDP